jgi:integrase
MSRERPKNPTAVARFTQARLSPNTRRAYNTDLHDFFHHGGKIPATPKQIVLYLAESAGWYTVGTLKRRLMAIRHAHVERGFQTPTSDPSIQAILRGIKRQYGTAQRQVKPLLRCHLRKIVKTMGQTPLALRDKALLLLGFFGAFRRSELVGLNVDDLEWVEEGCLVHLRHSKTDQEQVGRIIAIPRLRGSPCPVRALEKWLAVADIDHGPVFRRLTRSGTASKHRLDAAYVSLLLKCHLKRIGIDATDYSAHSLRAGLVTEAAKAGVPSWKIRQQTGHKTEAMVSRYIRDVDLWAGNAAAAAGRRN